MGPDQSDHRRLLDYVPIKPAPNRAVTIAKSASLAVLLVVAQIGWIFFAGIGISEAFMDGSPKRPAIDASCYAGLAAPSTIAIGISLFYLWQRYRTGTLRRKFMIVIPVLVVALYVAGLAAYGWIDDDIINRNVPHAIVNF